MLSVKLANDFEFEVESVSEIYDGYTKISNLSIQSKITGEESSLIQKQITPENIAKITVLLDEVQIDEFADYKEIVSIEKMITQHDRMLTIRLKTEAEG